MADFHETREADPGSAPRREAEAEAAGPIPTAADEEARKADADANQRRKDFEECRVGEFLPAAMARLHARAEGREKPIALPWTSVAKELGGGLWPGLYVLVGNTGSGKSQWALQVALEAARAGVPVLYVGLELGRLDLVARLVGLVTKKKWSRLYLGTDPAEMREVEDRHGEALAELGRVHFHLAIAPSHGWSYPELDAAATTMREVYPEKKYPSILVVLDFLQLVASPKNAREDLRERIGRAAYTGRAVARERNAAVILVSSTARDNYATLTGEKKDGNAATIPLGQGDPGRLVGLGKESGEVEYAADAALVLARKRWEKGEPAPPVWFAVSKIRARPEDVTGWVPLNFDGGRFEELTAEEREAEHKPEKKKARNGGDDTSKPSRDIFDD